MARDELTEPNGRQLAAACAEHDDGSTGRNALDRMCEAFAADRFGDQREWPFGQLDRRDDLIGSKITQIADVPVSRDSSH